MTRAGPLAATAVAHSNIALIKYWGKLQKPGNFPAVPSLSLTLDAFHTRTRVIFGPQFEADVFELNGMIISGHPLQRVSGLLASVRIQAGIPCFARVISTNNFPTASGLASSASGFAALALAASRAAQLNLAPEALSSIARSCSASAARSVYGGWAVLQAGAESAEQFHVGHDWDVVLIVVITDSGEKSVGSTDGMNRTTATSPVYASWLETAPKIFKRACEALQRRNLDEFGQCMEESTWMMHATMLTAVPAVVYLAPATFAIINEIRSRRSAKTPAYFTTDAGPHVKVFTLARHATEVKDWLRRVPGVSDIVICRPGSAAFEVPQETESELS